MKEIAGLVDLAPLQAELELENLAERALVVGDTELKRFVLTPLVAEFLRRRKPDVVREGGDRISESRECARARKRLRTV